MKDQTSKQEHMAKIHLQLKEPNFNPPTKTIAADIYKSSTPESLKDIKPNSFAPSAAVPSSASSRSVAGLDKDKDKYQQLSTMKANIQKLWESLGTDSSGMPRLPPLFSLE